MMSQPTKQITAFLAQLVLDIRSGDVSPATRNRVRQHLMDSVAAAFIGGKSSVFRDLVGMSSFSGQKADPYGSTAQMSQELAQLWAFAINGSVSEDGSREGACHPAAAIMPVILAFSAGKSWNLIEKAIIAGYDVMVRMARSGNPQFARKGFHATAITAPFGAAATLSQLLEFDQATTENALSLAAMGGSGLMASFKQGSTQPLQVSWGVGNGVTAALLAGRGHAGYPYIIEEGFFPAYLGSDGSASIVQDLENGYAINGCYLKPYPGCRHMHSSLYAFDALATENSFAPEDIDEISVGTYRVAIDTGIPTLNSRGDAYFNIPYAIAARSVLGRSTYDAFDERHFTNDTIVALMKKIVVSVDPQIEAHYPGMRGAALEVKFVSGQMLSKTVQYPLGEPENPVSLASTKEKMFDAAGDLLNDEEKEFVATTLLNQSGSQPLHAVAGMMQDKIVF
jgi:2-methylcitrate dehydratase PrpD